MIEMKDWRGEQNIGGFQTSFKAEETKAQSERITRRASYGSISSLWDGRARTECRGAELSELCCASIHAEDVLRDLILLSSS